MGRGRLMVIAGAEGPKRGRSPVLDIGRRDYIPLLGGTAAMAWPLGAWAQQPTMPVVGFLSVRGRSDDPHLTAAVLQGLKEAGFVEGRNIAIEYRYADNRFDR